LKSFFNYIRAKRRYLYCVSRIIVLIRAEQ